MKSTGKSKTGKLLWLWLWILLVFPVSAEPLSVFGGDYSVPKMYREEAASKGILVDILNYVSKKLPETEFRIELAPWARAYKNAVQGKGGIVGLSWTQERAWIFDYSVPLYLDEVVIVVPAWKRFEFRSMADLKGKRVGIGREGSYGEEYEKAKVAGVFSVEADDGPVMRLKKLLHGRMDCAFLNSGRAGFEAVLRSDRDLAAMKDAFVVLPVPLRSDPNFLAFPKRMNQRKFLAEFNAVIQAGYASGDIQKIIAANLLRKSH